MAIFDGSIEDMRVAGDAMLDHAQKVGQDLIAQATLNAQTVGSRLIDRALAGLTATIAGLDGWTASIVIAPITVNLHKPKPPTGIE